MNTTLFKQAMLAIVCALPLFLMGCSIHIPISTSMKTQASPPKKIQKTIFVVMSKEQEKKIILYKRSALANPFSFEAGKSVSSNLTQAMQYLFETAKNGVIHDKESQAGTGDPRTASLLSRSG